MLKAVLVLAICLFTYKVVQGFCFEPQLDRVAEVQEIDTQESMTVFMDKTSIHNPIIGKAVNFYRTYRFHNKTERIVAVKYRPWIEMWVDGVWYKLVEPAESGNIMPMLDYMVVPPGERRELSGDYLSRWKSQLAPGRYRKVWSAYFEYGEQSSFYIAVEFTVI